MTRILIVFSLVLAACSSAAAPSSTTTFVPVPDDLAPGVVDVRTATMGDGTVIEYGLVLPDGFDPGNGYPVLLALPPGGQGIDLAAAVAGTTYLPEARERGWVVVTPAAPRGELYFQGSERYIEELLVSLAWIRPEGGRYHIAGISNGGRSVFAVVALDPDMYASLVVFPGYPESRDDPDALAPFVDLPIAMFVGGEDPGWAEPMSQARDTLEGLGASVAFEIRRGEGHVMASLSDGVDVFDFLDANR